MENNLIVRERFLVVSHLEQERPYRIIGSAYKQQGEKDFVFHLRILPGVKFYITPDRDRFNWEYIIFSGRAKNDSDAIRYFAKIGSAIYLPKKNAVEIHLPDLRQVYYLKLEPEDYHCSEAKAA